MGVAQVFSGARALVYIENVLVGLYESVNYSVNISTETIHILGRYSAAEITPTAYEQVDLQCSGFRIIGNGASVLPKFPTLAQLLNLESITISVVDRQAGPSAPPILVVENCIPTSYSTGYQAKAVARLQVSYRGTKASDESGISEETGAATLP